MGFTKKNCRIGSSVCAIIMEAKSTMEMAHGKDSRKSCICPVIVTRKGKKVTEIHSVAVKIDFRKCTVASMEACQRVFPSAIISR